MVREQWVHKLNDAGRKPALMSGSTVRIVEQSFEAVAQRFGHAF